MAAAAGAGIGVRPSVTGTKPAEEHYRKELWQNPLREKIFLCFNDQKRGIMYAFEAAQAADKAPHRELCFFYAIQRILTAQQNVASLAHQCEVHQKAIVAGQKVATMLAAKKGEAPSQTALDAVVAKANDQFFKTLGLDHEKELDQFRLNVHEKELMLQMPANQAAMRAAQSSQMQKQDPNRKFMFAGFVAEKAMVERFALKSLSYTQYMTQEGMQIVLRTYGPFVIHGEFGLLPNKTRLRERCHIHPIVVVGLKSGKKKEDGIVCWVNPTDYSDTPTIHNTAFKTFTDKIGLGIGSPMEGLVAAVKEFSARAYYNPFFSRLPLALNPVYQALVTCGFQENVSSEILKFCAIELDHPYKLYDDHNRVVFAMPLGKVNKMGEVAVQKAQKGGTCFYYALRRILTTAQVRSEHGHQGSEFRKAITALDARRLAENSDEYQVLVTKALEIFLKHKSISMQEANQRGHAILSNTKVLRINPDGTVGAGILPQNLEVIHKYVHLLMAQGYGLEAFHPSDAWKTKEALIQFLRAKGPFVINGYFAAAAYNVPATVLPEKLGELSLYGWPDKASYTQTGNTHAIVVIGAEVVNDEGFVYWVDPLDSSEAKRIYKGSFDTFVNQMNATEVDKLTGRFLDSMAYCNPLFAAKN